MEIKTQRLTLFTIDKKQFKKLNKINVFKGPVNAEIVKKHLKRYRGYDDLMKWSLWVMKLNHSQEIIGEIGFHGLPDEKGCVDLAYTVYEDHRKKGYAKEAIRALIDHVEKQDQVTSILADCKKDNLASIQVLKSCDFDWLAERDGYFYYKKAIKY